MAGWDTVLTALVTSTATLTGVGLTHRYTFRRWELERLDDRRLEQRDAAVDLLDAGRAWSPAVAGLQLAVIGLRGDMVTLGNETQASERYAEPRKAMGRAVAKARLTVVDEDVRPVVLDLAGLYEHVGTATEEVRELAKRHALDDAHIAMLRYTDGIDAALASLERVAVERFSRPTTRRRRWRR